MQRTEVGILAIIGIIAVRYVILPLLGIGIVKAAHHFGMVGSSLLYQFILMLQYTLPPAMNVGMLTVLISSVNLIYLLKKEREQIKLVGMMHHFCWKFYILSKFEDFDNIFWQYDVN